MSKIPPAPPDPPDDHIDDDIIFESMTVDNPPQDQRVISVQRKRLLEANNKETPSKKPNISSLNSNDSPNVSQNTWSHPSLNNAYQYNEQDTGPFLVHVHRSQPHPKAGTTINKIQFGQILLNTKAGKIAKDGVKNVGRNRVSIQFLSPEDANIFVSNPVLSSLHFKAIIPTYNISRMGIVRDIPTDMSMEDLVKKIELPQGSGPILKARRLNRKLRQQDGRPEWSPSTTVVLTISGQRLPKYIYCCYSSLTVEPYLLPTIQCFSCCRFGHVRDKCRSKPRCFKCGEAHTGNTCSVTPESAYCCLCTGFHYATDQNCPELNRQKQIKKKMSEDNISYSEASTLFPPVSRSYSEVLQWNCRSVNNKKHEVSFLINQFNPYLFALSETWLNPGSLFRVPGFSCIRDDRSDGWAGCAILVRRNITFSRFTLPPHSPDINIVAVRCLNITFVSVYIPYPNALLIQELFSLLCHLPVPLLILGDLNIRHTLWGSASCDPIAPAFLDILNDLNLCIINDGTPTRRVSPLQNPSAPDLTLSSPSIAYSLSWSVLSNCYGSDHLPILCSLPDSSPPPVTPIPLLRFRLALADWHKFSSLVQSKLNSLPDVSSLNFTSLYDEYVSALTSAAEQSIPLKNSVKNKIPSPAWWDSECSAIVKKRKEAEIKFTRSLTYDNYLEFQKVSASSKRLLRSKKKKGWQAFCESLSPRTPASMIWKKIKAFRKSQSDDNINSNNPSSWLPNFMHKLAPPFVPLEPCPPISCSPSDELNPMNSKFSFGELCAALDHLRDSSPGVDGITYSFVIQSCESSKHFLLNLLNQIFLSGSIPESWKKQIIVPILKPGKDASDPDAYRPIALSSVLAKIMEHLIKNRLEWIVESKGILANSQFGFRRGLGTMDSLSLITSDIRLAFSRNEHVVGVFLDITSAYDNVNLQILRQKLHNLSIPPRIVNIVSNMFMERSISVRVSGIDSPPRLVWKGLPQGSVLSPILYNIYTADLESSVSCFCKALQYADDIALYATSDSFSDASNRINSALFYLNSWLSEHGLSLSASKSSAVIFSRKRDIPALDIHINNHPIQIANSVKFLGVFLDAKLSGLPHLNYICAKTEKNTNVIRALSGVRWGSHPYCQKLLYNAIIRSHFDYACFILEPCSKSALMKLERIQAKCLRIITGAMKSSPINALQVECVDPPLALRRQLLSDRFFYKVIELSDHPLLGILDQLLQISFTSSYWTHKCLPLLINSYKKLVDLPLGIFQNYKNPVFESSFESLIYKPNVILNLDIHKNSPDANQLFCKITQDRWPDHLQFFTDASRLSQNGPVGSAIWIPKYKIILNFKIPPPSSVFTGESIAILEAVLYIESHNISKSIIFTDSLSSLQDISKLPLHAKHNFVISLKIKEALFRCHSSGLDIVLAWIPGHCGIGGNEIADCCAKEAVCSGSNKYNKCFPRDLRSLARPQMFETWNGIWQQSRLTVGRYYGSLQPTLRPKPCLQPTLRPKPWFFNYRKLPKKLSPIGIVMFSVSSTLKLLASPQMSMPRPGCRTSSTHWSREIRKPRPGSSVTRTPGYAWS
ncbi:hypothetical protein K1T71_015073 [Dendrolimus kikuchii]|nr:hypothetical protein K1T71_015073 [Dendrolimus kikuchii]